MKQTFEQVRITPDIARKWLALNKVNRPISYNTVQTYADDMLNGRWDRKTTSCIAFSESGYLVDGQHRLSAIIVANIPVIMWVSRNVGERVVFDSGRTRTLSDHMNILHPELENCYHNNKNVAMIKSIIGLCRVNSVHVKVTPRELEAFIFEHKEDFDEFFSILTQTHVCKVTITVVWIAMFTAYKSGVCLSDLSHYYEVLASGIPLSSRDYPIIAYRDYLLRANKAISPTNDEIMKCQGSIKKYLTRSNSKRLCEPKDYVWPIPYTDEE